MKMVKRPADARELQPDPGETVEGSSNVKKILPDPDGSAKCDAEKYRLSQAAAQVGRSELRRRLAVLKLALYVTKPLQGHWPCFTLAAARPR